MNPFVPLSDSEKATWTAIAGAATTLEGLGKDPNFLKCLQPATLAFFTNGTPATVLKSVPGGNIKASAAQIYDILDKTLKDLEAVAKVADQTSLPIVNGFAAQALQSFKDLQAEAPKFQLQEAEKKLAEACADLAGKAADGIGKIYDPTLGATAAKKKLSAVKQYLTGIADSLGGARLMTEDHNVIGACHETVAEAYNVIAALQNIDPNAAKIVDAQMKVVQVANADFLTVRQSVAKQPHQTFVTLQNVNGSFAQQVVRNFAPCQEAITALDTAATHGATAYQGLEVWIYQFLRPKTPTTQIRQMVNVGFTKGTSPDPLVPSINPTTLEADHIISMKIMSLNPNWQFLTMQDKLDILNDVAGIGNFVGIGKSVNTSKGEKTYDEWLTFLQLDASNVVTAKSALKGKTVDKAVLDDLIKKEQAYRPVIDALIDQKMQDRKTALENQYSTM